MIRRATYDLTGVPPTPEEVDAFEKDKSPKAYENLIDRLLASPKYGERWGRHWLDVARYAEDDVRGLDPKGRGYMPFEGAYRYRDWVIKSFNADMAFNLFLRLQIAGDKIPAKTKQEQEEYLTATTYLGAGPWVWDQAEPIQGRADERNERVDAVTRGTLGMTVACARCHNHKYRSDYAKGLLCADRYLCELDLQGISDGFRGGSRCLREQPERSLKSCRSICRSTARTENAATLGCAGVSELPSYMVAAWACAGQAQGNRGGSSVTGQARS